MKKKSRQYLGLFCAVLSYFAVHEGAHLAFALCTGTFRQINFLSLGIQIDVYRDRMTDGQLGLFCLSGPVATVMAAWVLISLTGTIVRAESRVFRACMYYITIAMLFVDPVYLCGLYKLVGGGDMNGISLLLPERMIQIFGSAFLVVHMILFMKFVLSKYKISFEGDRSNEK